MKEKKGNTVLLTIIGIATLLIAVVGATFAYFTAVLSGEEDDTTMTITSGVIGMAFEGGAHINIQGIYPREEAWATKTFTLKGNSTETTTFPYTVSLVVNNNTFSAGSISFTLTSNIETNPNGTKIANIAEHTPVPTTGNLLIGSGLFQGPTGDEVSHVYNLNIFFLSTGVPMDQDQGKVFQAHIDVKPI